MENHETRRKVIRQWMSLPKGKRQTAEQAAEFAKKALEQNELQPSRRDPYERVSDRNICCESFPLLYQDRVAGASCKQDVHSAVGTHSGTSPTKRQFP
jgi:hypothetical protein